MPKPKKPNKVNEPWYKLKASADSVKLFLYGYIDPWEISATLMLQELMRHDGKDLFVHFHTDGGDVDEGAAIYAALKDYPGKVTGIVDSVCASISSLILMACDERLIRPTARVMVHQCRGGAYGTAAEMRAAADNAEIVNGIMVERFSEISGKAVEDINAEIADSDFWLSAKDAVEYGLCTGLYEVDNTDPLVALNIDAPTPQKLQHLKAYNAPASLVAQWQADESEVPEVADIEPQPTKLTAGNNDMTPEEYKDQERARRAALVALFKPHKKADALKAQCMNDLDCTQEQATTKLLAFLSVGPEGTEPSSPTVSGEDETKLKASTANKHLNNYFGAKLTACKWDDNNPYRHMSATEALRAHALSVGDTETAQMDKKKLVATAFNNNTHSLGQILETNLNALIINEVANLESWHSSLVTRQPMKFGTNDILVINDLGKPGIKTEGGKFTQVKLTVSGDTAVLTTLGYEIQITRELIMSDKFDFIIKQVQKAVRNCAQAPAATLVALLLANPALKDGKKLFSKVSGNEFDGPLDASTLADMSGEMADAQTSSGNPLNLKPEVIMMSNKRAKLAGAIMKAETIKDEPNVGFEAFDKVQGLADFAKLPVAFAFAHNDHVSFVEGYHEDADGVQVETLDTWKSEGSTIRIYTDLVIKAVDRKGVQKLNITA